MYRYRYVGSPNRALAVLSGTIIATGFRRIVHGGRGAYVEFTDDQWVESGLYIPPNARWRQETPKAYYFEYRVFDFPRAKVYYQKRLVDYADYRVGRWYISPIYLQNFERDGKY